MKTEADVYPNRKVLASTMRHEALFAVALCACWREQARVEVPATPIAPVAAYRAPPRDPRPRAEDAQVGSWSSGRFVAATTIALEVGTQYGWRIRLPCTGPVAFTETLALPGPTTWGNGRNTTISADQSVATTKAEALCSDGWIEHYWFVNGDDPPGEYEVTVEIDGWATVRLRTTFVAP